MSNKLSQDFLEKFNSYADKHMNDLNIKKMSSKIDELNEKLTNLLNKKAIASDNAYGTQYKLSRQINEIRQEIQDATNQVVNEANIIKDLIIKPLNKAKVMALKPTLIGKVAGVKFFEDPIRGDEVPLIADTGKSFGRTDFFELPDFTEITEQKLDPVGKEDEDIDNDGDEDESDEFLKARRDAIAGKEKSMKE